jgi:hypothetical protein
LFGFDGAFRASELCALDVEDIEFCEQGMRIHIIREGAIFRVIAGRRSQRITSARLRRRNVALLVKSRVAVGTEGAYSAHSLRSGWIATAAARGASIFKLKGVAGTNRRTSWRAMCGLNRCSQAMRARGFCSFHARTKFSYLRFPC